MRFFFYGTLVAGSGNAVERAAHRRLRPIGPASVAGTLWAIPTPLGWYPALLAGGDPVAGVVYDAAGFTDADLARLDAYEGADYRREPIEALVDGTAISVQAYRWIGALPADALRLPTGEFAAFLRDTGAAAYAAR